jgi:hypothetical protein
MELVPELELLRPDQVDKISTLLSSPIVSKEIKITEKKEPLTDKLSLTD